MDVFRIFRSAAPATSTLVLIALAAVASAQENAWTSHGPTDVGWVNDLAIVDSVAYAATLNGVFRSNDRGTSWQESGLAGEWIAQIVAIPGAGAVLATVFHPKDPALGWTLYASRDAGTSWTAVSGLPPVTSLAIDPRQPSTAYVGTENAAIWKSTDAGSSWQRLSATPGGYGPLVFAFDSRAIYVMAFDTADSLYKLYKSSDGGVSWATISPPIPYPTTIAAGTASGFVYTGGVGNFCRSADSADTWTCSRFQGFPIRIVEVPGGGPGAAPQILALAEGTVYVSRDGGVTWGQANGELGSAGYVARLASDATGSLVLAGTQTAVLRSHDRGDSWTAASTGLHSSWINALASDPHDPSKVWAAAEGFAETPQSGLFRSADRGLSWSLGNGPAGSPSIRALAIGPGHPSTLYAGGSAHPFSSGLGSLQVYRSDDDGEHWTGSAFPGGGTVQALAPDPGSPERVWAASYGGLFRSDDGARTWTSPPAVAQDVYCILFDGKRTGTIYAGSYFDVDSGFYPEPYGGSIFVSRNSGANWTKSQHDFGSPVLAIATDPFHVGVLYVGTRTGIFRSADDGVTWHGRSEGLPPSGIRILVADPVRPGRLYAASEGGGVYRTIDGAQTWHPFSSGLGSLQAWPLVISTDGRWLHAGTNGGGVFEIDLEVLDRRILPVVGSTPGANGTFFRTSVQLNNPSTTPATGRIVFHPSGAAGSDTDPALPYSLTPGQTLSIADLLPAMGRSGIGSADIEIISGAAPVATARVFNDAGPSGTTGFTEEAMRAEEALRLSQTGVLLIPADFTVARFNVGVRTLEEGASVTLTLKNAAGALVGSTTRVFPTNYHEQQDAVGFLGVFEAPPGGSISITVNSGAAIFYGATVDNSTGDPSLQITNARQ
jgi:photosystem II stability/assembly factor-like uncharacterized protein